jgi:hypothetical protein
VVAFTALVITCLIVLLAALTWMRATVPIARMDALNVRRVHAALGILLAGVMAGVLLRLPLLVAMLLALALIGLRNANARLALHDWWHELRQTLAQHGWVILPPQPAAVVHNCRSAMMRGALIAAVEGPVPPTNKSGERSGSLRGSRQLNGGARPMRARLTLDSLARLSSPRKAEFEEQTYPRSTGATNASCGREDAPAQGGTSAQNPKTKLCNRMGQTSARTCR